MKPTLTFLTLLALLMLPLACKSRAVTQPVNPAFAATPTSTLTTNPTAITYMTATPTPTP